MFEAVAIAVHRQDVDVVRQPVQERAGQPFGAQDARPVLERQVRRDDGGASLVASGEDLEQQLGSL